MSSMSRLRPVMSAPRRPMKATSEPSTASQLAMLAPEPPPCMVTTAGVSLALARGNLARATASVMRSPTTTTRVMMSPPCQLLVEEEPGPAGGATTSPCCEADAQKPNSFRPSRGAGIGQTVTVDAQALSKSSVPELAKCGYVVMWGVDVVWETAQVAVCRARLASDAC